MLFSGQLVEVVSYDYEFEQLLHSQNEIYRWAKQSDDNHFYFNKMKCRKNTWECLWSGLPLVTTLFQNWIELGSTFDWVDAGKDWRAGWETIWKKTRKSRTMLIDEEKKKMSHFIDSTWWLKAGLRRERFSADTVDEWLTVTPFLLAVSGNHHQQQQIMIRTQSH